MPHYHEDDTEKIDFKYNLKVYWSILRKYKILFVSLLSVILFLELTYIIDKYLFKIIIDNGTEYAAGSLLSSTYVKILIIIAVVFCTLALLRTVAKWFHLHLTNHLDARLGFDLKTRFFNHLLYLHYGFHTGHKTGSLISRLIRGRGAIERMTDIIVFNAAPLFFQIITVTGAIFYFDPAPAIVVLLTVFTFVTYSLIIHNLQQDAHLKENEAEDTEKANISDIFTNIESIKYFGKESRIQKIYRKLATLTKKAQLRNWSYFRWLDSGHALILGTGTFFVVYFPMVSFLKNEITIGSVVFIYTAFGVLYNPMFGFVNGIRNFYKSMADFQALFQYEKIENEVKDRAEAKQLKIKQGTIEFKNVTFKYKTRNILTDFSLTIPKNKKVALVGPSGAGKSTIIKLLFRLYDIDKGQILIDGKDVRDLKKASLRSEIAIVPQECILFDDTVLNNIRFARPSATRKEVLKAMKFAQLDKVARDFPQKENTIVGERGVKLSGGEKQRVSVARAILANKKVLVLDEATSSLDSETEHAIQNALRNLMKNRTSISIAHRLSTIMNADMIIVLDKGKVVQKGTHRQLIKKPGLYKKLWNLQKGGYIK